MTFKSDGTTDPSVTVVELEEVTDTMDNPIPGAWAVDGPLAPYPTRFGDGRVVTAADL